MSITRLASIWPDWQVTEQIGEGSFGKVYKAVHTEHSMTSFSAIKVISVPQNESELRSLNSEGLDESASKTYFYSIVNDFVSEIKLMESMKGSSNIVNVEDFKVLEKQNTIGYDIFIRMELLTPFVKYLNGKRLSQDEVIDVGIDICSALERCNARNVIHRDIKPENIFVSDFGDFKLGDFGIAKELEKTRTTMSAKGTFNYMAPEVAAGKRYDRTVDIYSLGIVLYRLLNNNRLPFMDPYSATISFEDRKLATDKRLSGLPLPPPANATPTMTNVLNIACNNNPASRFQTAKAFKNALTAARGSVSKPKVKPTPVMERSGENPFFFRAPDID